MAIAAINFIMLIGSPDSIGVEGTTPLEAYHRENSVASITTNLAWSIAENRILGVVQTAQLALPHSLATPCTTILTSGK